MYSVPIIPPDLRHEETIIQAANALDYLQKTITDVFARIDDRIERNHEKVRDLQNRIDSASKTINGLIGINKAIKIFSPSKFPAVNLFHDIPKTFDELKHRPAFELAQEYRVASHQDPISHRNIQEKLVFYHVRSNMQAERTKSGRVVDPRPGLGCIPNGIRSVNSLLRFSTGENCYQKEGISDGTFRSAATARRKEKTASAQIGQKIEAPPISMTDRKTNERKSNSGLFYTPKLDEAPQLDVPLDLPDLPGIADDITFELAENERIAPSLHIDNLPDLPEPETIATANPVVESSIPVDEIATKVVASKELSNPPPPPPPPLAVAAQSTVITQLPPPPPPPPPPPSIPSSSKSIATPSSPAPVGMADARMNLMEAIRKAGGAHGAKLRTAAAAEVTKNSETDSKRVETKPPSGDLMADLHNKLLMRRKGISGAKEQEGTTAGSSGNVLDRLSAIIPPPPPKQPNAAAANNSATDASDENDEWTD